MKESKVGSTLIVDGNRFLLIKSTIGAAKGLWNNPGGRLNKDESFEEGAKRETLEETAFNVNLGKLINSYYFKENESYLVTKKVFEATIINGKLNLPFDEIEEARWFTLDEIKKMDELGFTYGAKKSILDFTSKKYNQVYYPERIA